MILCEELQHYNVYNLLFKIMIYFENSFIKKKIFVIKENLI